MPSQSHRCRPPASRSAASRRRPLAQGSVSSGSAEPPITVRPWPAAARSSTAVPPPGAPSARIRPPIASRRRRVRCRPRPWPYTSRLSRAFQSVEHLEDPLALVRRDSRTAIDHAHGHSPGLALPLHSHFSLGRVFQGVVEQVKEDALDRPLVGLDRREEFRQLEPHCESPGGSTQAAGDPRRRLGQIHRPGTQREPPRFQRRKVEDRSISCATSSGRAGATARPVVKIWGWVSAFDLTRPGSLYALWSTTCCAMRSGCLLIT